MPRSTPHTEETKKKIGLANKGIWITFNCDYCGKQNEEKHSHYKKKKRHFCNRKCYSSFRKEMLPKEEQHAYKDGGMPEEQKQLRRQSRRKLNYEVEMGRVEKLDCESCGKGNAQGHHHDYTKPLDVKWLCKDCHWAEHKIIYENPELIKCT